MQSAIFTSFFRRHRVRPALTDSRQPSFRSELPGCVHRRRHHTTRTQPYCFGNRGKNGQLLAKREWASFIVHRSSPYHKRYGQRPAATGPLVRGTIRNTCLPLHNHYLMRSESISAIYIMCCAQIRDCAAVTVCSNLPHLFSYHILRR